MNPFSTALRRREERRTVLARLAAIQSTPTPDIVPLVAERLARYVGKPADSVYTEVLSADPRDVPLGRRILLTHAPLVA